MKRILLIVLCLVCIAMIGNSAKNRPIFIKNIQDIPDDYTEEEAIASGDYVITMGRVHNALIPICAVP